ncbi:MAG: protein kinase [Acidobacteriota bacterium]
MTHAVKLTVSPGTVVADRFAIRRFIAEGGMGEVYAARDLILEEDIAIKFLSRRNIGDENVIRRFHREIQLARKVTHPNVCRLFDVYRTSMQVPATEMTVPVTFVTMELLHGTTLEDRLVRDGALDEDEALPIAVQMCQALTAAHDAGVIHRDFKSNNVMVDDAGDRARVVVTDFGLARSILPSDPSRTPLTADQLILGTAEYMAPEQIKGEPVSHKSDLYALGVVLFEMLTGQKPYEAANPMQLLVKRVSEKPANPRDFKPDLSKAWESVIVDCLAEAPGDRPSSAQEIIERLGGVPVRQTPAPTPVPEAAPGPTAPDGPGRPGAVGPWFAVALLALAVAAFWASRSSQGPPERPATFNPQRLTTGPGLEFNPAFSPDGERLVYSEENADGTFRLVVHELDDDGGSDGDGGRPLVIETGGVQGLEPSWSPAGDDIAFSTRDGGIAVVPVEGGAVRPVIERGSRPAYAPDGARLAFQSTASPLLSDTTVPAMPPSVLGLYDFETAETRWLTQANQPVGGHGQPSWSPDGRHLVFAATGRSVGELWAVRIEDGGLVPLLREPAKAYDPVVAADGSAVYFAFRSLEVKTLWRLDISPDTFEPRGDPVEIAGLGLSSVRQPRLSRDGRHLVFAAYVTRSNLWRLPLGADGTAAGPPTPLTQGDDRYNRPVFSPDGARVLFDHWKLGVDIDLFSQDVNGGPRRQLTDLAGTNSQATWRPDGRVFYGAESPDGRKSLRRLTPSDGDDVEVLSLDDDVDWVVFSPLEERFAFHSGRGGQGLDVWVQALDGAPAWRLTFHEQSAGFPAFSPDGLYLAYQVRRRGGSDLWIAPLDGGEPRRLLDANGESWPYSFSADGSKILFAGQRNSVWNLYSIDVATSEVLRLTENLAVTGYLRYPAWSPTDDLVVYEKAETASDLFIVRDFFAGP